jgi:peptidoglycan/LPS O-acetylase OafA/YrhL
VLLATFIEHKAPVYRAMATQMAEQHKHKPYLSALTGLRFFTAIYVVLFHHADSALSVFLNYIQRFIKYGYISVSLFFVLSGFVLAYTYLDTKNEATIDVRRFWIARFARIYPLYLVALIVSAPAFIAKFSELGAVHFFLTGVSTISLLQAWTPWTATVWNTPAWAVSVEVFCYALFPFLAPLINQLDNRAILLLAFMLWITALIAPLIYPLIVSNWMIFVFIIYAPIFHLPQFLIGVCAGILFLRRKIDGAAPMYSTITFLAVFSSLVILVGLTQTPNIPYELLNNGLLAPIFALIIWALSYGRGAIAQFLSLPLFILLGEASYAIYLLQNPLLSSLKLVFSKPTELNLINPIFVGTLPFFLEYLGILISVSISAFLFIETPLKKALNRTYNIL